MSTPTNLTSSNWAGAVINAPAGKSFSTISAQWTVPTVTQIPVTGIKTSNVASWIGLDGAFHGSKDVCQAGIQETVRTGTHGTSVSYSAWDEWYPAGSQTIAASSFKVNPGDTIGITIATAGAGSTKANFMFDDLTTGQTLQTSLTAPAGTSLIGDSAEFVAETPQYSIGSRSFMPPLADFLATPIVFQDATAGYADGTLASLASAQTIGLVSQVRGISGSVQEAYGSVSASSDTVTVTENQYWGSSSSSANNGFFW